MNCVVNTSIAPRITDILRSHTILYKGVGSCSALGGHCALSGHNFYGEN